MQVEFAFSLKQKVVIPSGLEAEVEGLYLSKHNVKMVYVRYDNKNGSSVNDWFDEDQIKPVA